ncbi:MAG TPA: polysaccharide biosynthesis tyrosine autokinase [Coleofasciculaceae cyanobacterium]
MNAENAVSSISLQQYLHVIKRRWLPASVVFALVVAPALLLTYLAKPVYEAEGKLRFKGRSLASSLTELGDGNKAIEPLMKESNPLSTEMGIIRAVPTLQETIERLNLKDEKGKPLQRSQLLKNLRLVNDLGTDLLTITYRDQDPKRAKAIVDTLIETYLEENLRSSRAEVTTARSFLSGQLPAAEARVHELELELRRFKEQYQVVSIEEEGRSAITTLADLQHRIAEKQSELSSVEAESTEFHNQLGMDVQQAATLTTLSQSAGVQKVLEDLQGVESQLAAERVRFQDSHPAVTALLEKKANLESLLNQRIAQTLGSSKSIPIGALQAGAFRSDLATGFVQTQIQRAGLENELITLSNVERAYQQRINALPGIEQELRELERKLDAAQTTYSLLLKRFQEAQVAENQNIGNAQVVQTAALLEDPVAPNILLNLAAGGVVGALLAIITVLLCEAQDQSIRTIQEAKDLFGDILLGIIPLHQRDSYAIQRPGNSTEQVSPDVVMYHAPGSPTSEAYRMLQANLRSISVNKGQKTIIVTSSIPREGKSVVSANLALALAQTNRRVLLIDADMRCPRQHKLWGLSNGIGLSQVLTAQSDLESAIQSGRDLDVLTAGSSPAHPSTLLDSERATELLHACSERYDFVIIDTPAWNVAADVAVLSQKADGVLFVVRPGVIDADSARFAKESLKQSNQSILGLVINGASPMSDSYTIDKKYYSKAITSAQIPVARTNGSRIGV